MLAFRNERTPLRKSSQARPYLAMVAILCLAALLRLRYISSESAWFDEVVTLLFLNVPTLSEFIEQARHISVPTQPLYFVLEYYWAQSFGAGETTMRLLSVVFGLASIWLVFLIGRSLWSPWTGVLAALLAAVSQFHIVYSQEVRMYAMMYALVLASVYIFVRLTHHFALRWLVFHAVITALIAWTHILGLLILPIQALWLIFLSELSRKDKMTWLALQAIAVLSLLPWLVSMNYQEVRGQYTWREQLPTLLPSASSHESVVRTLYVWMTFQSFLNLSEFEKVLGRVVNALWVVLYITAGAVMSAAAITRRRTLEPFGALTPRWVAALLMAWWFIPLIVLYVGSHVWAPVFFPRYVGHSLFAMCLVLAAVVIHGLGSRWRTIAVVGIVGLSLMQAVLILQGPFRQPWKLLVPYVVTHFDPPPSTTRLLGAHSMDCQMLPATYLYHFRYTGIEPECFGSPHELAEAFLQQTPESGPYVVIVPDTGIAVGLTATLDERGITHTVKDFPAGLHVFTLDRGDE